MLFARAFKTTCLLLAVPLLLAGCTTLPRSVTTLSAEIGVERFEDPETGKIELLLEPIDVWNDKGAKPAEEISINDHSLYFRLRETDTFEQAWVRLGLFWHSSQEKIILPIVITGPPVTIRKVHIKADRSSATLKLAKNFNFAPAERAFDKKLSSAAFTISPNTLAALVKAKNGFINIVTNRGGLQVNLSVVPKLGENDLIVSAKYQFADFYRRHQAIKE